MTVEGIFFDLGGTLFSYRNVARTNIPILIESAARLGADADAKAIKIAYGRAAEDVSRVYADKPYYRHRDMFHDMFARFCELLDVDYDAHTQRWYHDTQQQAILDCLEIKADCIETLQFLKGRGLYLSIVSNIDDDMLEPLVEREGSTPLLQPLDELGDRTFVQARPAILRRDVGKIWPRGRARPIRRRFTGARYRRGKRGRYAHGPHHRRRDRTAAADRPRWGRS